MDMNLSKLREMVKDMKDWHATVHGVSKSQTRLSDWTTIPLLLFTWGFLVCEHLDTSLYTPKGNEGRNYAKHITKAFHETVYSLTQKLEIYILKIAKEIIKQISVSVEN